MLFHICLLHSTIIFLITFIFLLALLSQAFPTKLRTMCICLSEVIFMEGFMRKIYNFINGLEVLHLVGEWWEMPEQGGVEWRGMAWGLWSEWLMRWMAEQKGWGKGLVWFAMDIDGWNVGVILSTCSQLRLSFGELDQMSVAAVQWGNCRSEPIA